MVHDELRLKGSSIPNGDRLLVILDAVRVYLCHKQPDPCDKPCEDPCINGVDEARAAMREVRFSVNDYRDNSWNGMLQLRNQTMVSLLLTELAGYALLAIAIIGRATAAQITAGLVFFLVGAAVGLFNRLYQQSQADTSIEDYGLSVARLLTLPAYSGLAAVGGVLLTGLSTGSSTTPIRLSSVFDVSVNPSALLVAAVFSLAPSLLVTRLGQASDQFKKAIKSTEASGE